MAEAASPAKVWRSATRLADGREIIYFDESPGSGRAEVADSRDLPPQEVQPATSAAAVHLSAAAPNPLPRSRADGALRWDALTGDWIMAAAQRQDRTYRPAPGECPLCPARPGHPTEIPAPDYDVVVFQNRFPALTASTGGRCEVICFTSDHDSSFAELTPRRAATIFEAWADRTAELGALPSVEHVYCFENRGEEIGATLRHPHGQVYAFPFVPARVQRMLAQAGQHARTGRNFFDDVVEAELADGRRIVARNEHWVAFVPFAARWPFEVMIFPLTRVPSLPAVGEEARDAFGPVYLDVLRRLDGLFGVPMPYMSAWQQAPAGPDAAGFGLHVHVMGVRRRPDKLKYQAGTESAGAWSNDVLPETAAGMLRAVPP